MITILHIDNNGSIQESSTRVFQFAGGEQHLQVAEDEQHPAEVLTHSDVGFTPKIPETS